MRSVRSRLRSRLQWGRAVDAYRYCSALLNSTLYYHLLFYHIFDKLGGSWQWALPSLRIRLKEPGDMPFAADLTVALAASAALALVLSIPLLVLIGRGFARRRPLLQWLRARRAAKATSDLARPATLGDLAAVDLALQKEVAAHLGKLAPSTPHGIRLLEGIVGALVAVKTEERARLVVETWGRVLSVEAEAAGVARDALAGEVVEAIKRFEDRLHRAATLAGSAHAEATRARDAVEQARDAVEHVVRLEEEKARLEEEKERRKAVNPHGVFIPDTFVRDVLYDAPPERFSGGDA